MSALTGGREWSIRGETPHKPWRDCLDRGLLSVCLLSKRFDRCHCTAERPKPVTSRFSGEER